MREFFELLGEDRCAQLTHVSADGADAPPRPGNERAKALKTKKAANGATSTTPTGRDPYLSAGRVAARLRVPAVRLRW